MKTTKRLTALVLILGLLVSFCMPVMASDYWWTEYVSAPTEDWRITTTGQVESTGSYALFTSDCHRYTYLVKDLLAAANTQITADGKEGNVGLVAFGGDFANEKLVYDDNMSILKAALETSQGTVASYTKGNHEGDVSDEDFEKMTGMKRIGETVTNKDGAYYFYNFGAFNGTTQFLTEDIAALDSYLAAHSDKPVFIVSHYPIHYYNDRRSAINADKLVDALNKHPNAIFLWGHNHTEQDPNYGMVRVPGDVIQTGASADTTREIQFTYACLGALRDGINGANGLLANVDGSTVTFRYINLKNSVSDDTWTDAQGNENSIRVAGAPEISSRTVVDTKAPYETITLANLQIDRPLVDHTPAASANEYSPRFKASALNWTVGSVPVDGKFDFNTEYTVSTTLTAEDGYSFASDAVVSVNKEYVGPMPGQKNGEAVVEVSPDGKTAKVTYTFPVTVASAAPVAMAEELRDGGVYVLAATDANMAASYLYDPTQHGEESMPDYTVSPADVVVRDGKLISASTASTLFTAQKDAHGFLLLSDESLKAGQGATTLNFLSMSTRGGELGLEAAETAGLAIYNNWGIEAGVPFLNVDGAKQYAAFAGGKFTFVSDPKEANVRLFQVGTNNSSTIYNVSVSVPTPVAGQKPAAIGDIAKDYPTYTVESIEWTTGAGEKLDAETLDYNTAYTAAVTVTPKSGYQFSDSALTGRISGTASEILVKDGKATLTCTFPATSGKPGSEVKISAKKASGLENGKRYVIVADSAAMTANSAEGLYLGSSAVTASGDTITSKVTMDMVFTAEGNDKDGYALKNGSTYLAGRAVDDSPDKWGFDTADKASAAVTFAYEDGKLKVVSTGAAPGGLGGPGGPGAPPPPPGGSSDSFLYLYNGHFNFSTFQSSGITLYELPLGYSDVAASRWSYNEIYDATLLGLMNGMGDGKFSPNGDMTRGMAITILYRLDGEPEVKGENVFTDVKEGVYYADAANWGSQNGVVNGVGGGKFEPEGKVTREQFAAMVSRYMSYKKVPASEGETISFLDANDISSYAKEHVDICVKAKIINGVAEGNGYVFQPKSNITREQAAAMLVRLMDAMK